MAIPTITTRTTNLELTNERQALITQKLAPLRRLLVHEQEAVIDVMVRRIRGTLANEKFYVSLRLQTDQGSYMAVASHHYLTRAITDARDSLRRNISRGASVERHQVAYSEQYDDSYTLTL
jgi:ribosome-associated translation inhibitor RaiA